MDEKQRLRIQAWFGDDRTLERLVAPYQVETELADRLRNAIPASAPNLS
jgi:hypothetical protein